MNEILKAYASVSVSAALLTIVLLLFRPLYQRIFSKRWQYYIWLIVVARFLIPWNPGNGIVGNLFQQTQKTFFPQISQQQDPTQQMLLQEQDPSEQQTFTQQDPSEQQTLLQADPLQNTAFSSQSADNHDRAENNSITKNRTMNLQAIWLLTALVLFVRKITVYQSFVNYLKAGCSPVEDIRRLEMFGKMIEQKRIKCAIGLYTNCLTASPLLIGFIHPAVILTKAELSDTEFYHTVLHELTHYKRRDLLYKWLVQITVCLHWFNPFAYLMAREVSRMCELSCDEAATDLMDEESKRAYGDTLLHAMCTGGFYKNSLASITLGGGKQLLKERLGELMKTKKRSKRITAAAIAAAVLLAGGAVAAGAYVQPAAAGKPKKEIRLSDCRIIEKNGIFYILCEGAVKSDMPTGGVTDGCVGIMLVKPDEYTSIGPFEHMDRLVRDVKKQAEQLRKKKKLTAEEASLLTQAAEKIQKDASQEAYDFISITKKKGAYYYRGSRIRIFMDQRTDESFVKFKYDEKGEIDICLRRAEDFSVASISFLTEEEAEEILEDLEVDDEKAPVIEDPARPVAIDESAAAPADSGQIKDANQGIYVSRLTKEDLPAQIKQEIARCKQGNWYRIKHKNCTYIYYDGLPNDYAFKPALSTQKAKIRIVDMGGSESYVLLAVYGNVPVTVTYQNQKVACKEISLKQER